MEEHNGGTGGAGRDVKLCTQCLRSRRSSNKNGDHISGESCLLHCVLCMNEDILDTGGQSAYVPAGNCKHHGSNVGALKEAIKKLFSKARGGNALIDKVPLPAMVRYLEYLGDPRVKRGEKTVEEVALDTLYSGTKAFLKTLTVEHEKYKSHVDRMQEKGLSFKMKPIDSETALLPDEEACVLRYRQIRSSSSDCALILYRGLYEITEANDATIEFLQEEKEFTHYLFKFLFDDGIDSPNKSVSNWTHPVVFIGTEYSSKGRNFVSFLNAGLRYSDLAESLHESLVAGRATQKDEIQIEIDLQYDRPIEDAIQLHWEMVVCKFNDGYDTDHDMLVKSLICPKGFQPPSRDARSLEPMETSLWHAVCEALRLNESQREAVRASLEYQLSSIKGPPGTGKTTVNSVVLFLDLWVKQLRNPSENVHDLPKTIVAAPSNVAVDAQLASFITILSSLKSGGNGRPILLQHFDATSREVRALDQLCAALLFDQDRCIGKKGEKLDASTDYPKATVPLIHRVYASATTTINEDLKRQYHLNSKRCELAIVYFTTCDMLILLRHATSKAFLIKHSEVLLLDEASSISIPKLAVLLGNLKLKKITIVGDENQLTPYVAPHMRHRGDEKHVTRLQLSAITMSMVYHNYSRRQLNICYRGPQGLYDFVFKTYYQELVTCSDQANVRPTYQKIVHPMEKYHGYSFQNRGHVSPVQSVIRKIKNEDPDGSIIVLTPYTGQRVLLQYELNDLIDAKVRSIDQYQGGEADHIIFSLPKPDAGFLKDELDVETGSILVYNRRLVVALTRAKNSLTVIGNISEDQTSALNVFIAEECTKDTTTTYDPCSCVFCGAPFGQ